MGDAEYVDVCINVEICISIYNEFFKVIIDLYVSKSTFQDKILVETE